MKKKIVTLLLTGLVGMVLMGFRTTEPGTNGNNPFNLTLIKGDVTASNPDGGLELLTFGIDRFNPSRHAVAYVEFLTPDGTLIGKITLPEGEKADRVFWFTLDISPLNIPVYKYEFDIKVHVINRQWLKFNTDFSGSKALNSNGAPNDPEETILIVRYP